MSTEAPYDREALYWALVYHQATNTSGCICGWAVLGASHPEHVADEYEKRMKENAGSSPERIPMAQCNICGAKMSANLLRAHLISWHGASPSYLDAREVPELTGSLTVRYSNALGSGTLVTENLEQITDLLSRLIKSGSCDIHIERTQ